MKYVYFKKLKNKVYIFSAQGVLSESGISKKKWYECGISNTVTTEKGKFSDR